MAVEGRDLHPMPEAKEGGFLSMGYGEWLAIGSMAINLSLLVASIRMNRRWRR